MFADTLYREPDGTISHTKFWSNIGYLLMCLAFIGITVKMSLMQSFPTGEWIEIFMVFGAFVAIPRGFSKWISYKAGKMTCDEEKEKKPDEDTITKK